MDNVEQFIEQLLVDKGITDLDPDVKKELKTQMLQELMNQIDRAAINALPEDKAVELAKNLDDPLYTNEQASEFIAKSGIDLQQISLQTMMQFRNFYLSDGQQYEREARF